MKKITFLLVLIPFLGLSQVQIGDDVLGEFISDQLGWDVSISSDGSTIAISAPSADQNGDASGSVRVFNNIDGDWIQIGENINGESEINFSGISIDLSSDGNVLAIGARLNSGNGWQSGHVRVFENIEGNWVQLGFDIDGENAQDQSGRTVSLSSNGNIVAIGSVRNYGNGSSAGHVRIFEIQSGVWTQLGQDIDGEAEQDLSSYSLSLSSNGNVVAIGAPYNDGNDFETGHVRIFENQGGNWIQLGSDIDGALLQDRSGWSVSLSSDGNIVAIGAELGYEPGGIVNTGQVRVFENQGGNWIQLGSNINGDFTLDNFGTSLSLSSNGKVLVVGAYKNDFNGEGSGQIKVFNYNSLEWIQVGDDIYGDVQGFGLGYRVDISADGNSIITGAPSAYVNGYNSGLSRVYSFASELAILEVVDDILGNTNGINITANQLNSIEGVSGALEGVNYTTALDNGIFVDENNPTAAEIQFIIDQVNETLSLNYTDIFSFSIYPNPTKNQFTIQLDPSVQLEKVSIYNILSQVVLTSEETIVDTSKLSSGSYVVEISTNKGKSTKQLIIN